MEVLTPAMQELMDAALAVAALAYAPYSGFRVGAALLLTNGETVQSETGSGRGGSERGRFRARQVQSESSSGRGGQSEAGSVARCRFKKIYGTATVQLINE